MTTEAKEKLRHTSAHVVAQAVLRLFPNAKLGIGPVTQKGFYYDILVDELIDKDLTHEQLKTLKKKLYTEIIKIIEAELPLTQTYMSREEAIDMLHQQGQIFKTELLQKVPDEEISFYKTGDEFIDLCRGPHLKDTGKIGAIKLTTIKKVNWMNDPGRPELIRFSGLAFESEEELAEYKRQKEELKQRDHRKNAWEQNLYFPTENTQGTGSEVILDRGIKIKRRIVEYFSSELDELGFSEVEFSPFWLTKTLAQDDASGFIPAEEIIEMNKDISHVSLPLPQLIELFSRWGESNKHLQPDLDDEEFEIGVYYTNRKLDLESYVDASSDDSKPLETGFFKSGLIEQFGFTEIFSSKHLKANIREIVQLLVTNYRQLFEDGEFQLEASFIKSESDDTESELVQMLVDTGINLAKVSTEDSFLIRLRYIDELERSWILAEIKYNTNLNEFATGKLLSSKFPQLKEQFSQGKKSAENNLILLHGEMIENIEKLVALISEKHDGLIPFAIAPYQAVVISEAERFDGYAQSIASKLRLNNVRVKLDLRELEYERKLEDAYRLRYPYILKVGDQEETNEVISVKPGNGEDLGLMSLDEFLQKLDR